jgi:hypothetical protein
MSRFRSIVSFLGAYLAIVGLALAGLVASPTTAGAQTGGFQRGPNPGPNTLTQNGPFQTSQVDVSGMGAGYNNVTICYPNDTSEGTFGGVVVMPGFISLKLQMMWACRKIASHGFVVAATGWSMGGGGALETGQRNNPHVEAVVGFEPWDIGSFPGMRVPTMIVGASADFVAPPASMAEPFYNSITSAEKYYVEIAGQSHFVGSSDNPVQSAATIAWLKRWVDNDTRYDQFLCPAPRNSAITEIRQTCPMEGTG